MIVTITVRMAAESKGELINTFGSQVQHYKDHIEQLRLGSVFGPPEKIELRFLIIGGEWSELPDVVTTAQEVQPAGQDPTEGQMPDVPSGVDAPEPR